MVVNDEFQVFNSIYRHIPYRVWQVLRAGGEDIKKKSDSINDPDTVMNGLVLMEILDVLHGIHIHLIDEL